jgi:uracil-DNA glycosylase
MNQPKYVPGIGPIGAKLAIVGEAPGRDEDLSGRPFEGPAGGLLNGFLREAGINRNDCYVTNVIKFRPPENDMKRLNEIGVSLAQSTQDLFDELHTVRPNCVLALGNTALQALTNKTGIKVYRGSVLRSSDFKLKVVPTFHPAHLLRQAGSEVADYAARAYVSLDFAKAARESLTPEYHVPDRLLTVCRNSLDLYRFKRQYAGKWKVAVDIESYKCIPVCVSFAFSRYHAISVPLINMVDEKRPEWIPYHELVQMWKFVSDILDDPRYELIGQNFKFDDAKLRSPCGFRPATLYADTMLMAHTLYPEFPLGLAFLASIWTDEPYYKTEGKEFNPKRDTYDRLYLYNAKDAAITFEVFEEQDKELAEMGLSDFYYNYVNKLHNAYRDLEQVGLLFDAARNKELKKKYQAELKEVQTRLNENVGWSINVASPKQISELLYRKMALPLRKDTSEDTIVALQNNICKDETEKLILSDVLTIRRIRKTLGTYLNARPDYDGRMRTSYRIVGAETGRTSTTLLKAPVRPHKIGLAFQTMTKHGDTGSDLRSQFIADEGYVFVEIDSSQAEARVVALLANDLELLNLFDTTDVHSLTSTWLFGCVLERVTYELRFVGKTTRHAGNYGMGKARLMQIINTDAKKFHINIQVSEWKAGQILDAFHSFSPKIRQVFHTEVVQALRDNDRTLINPFGRRRQFFGRFDHELEKESFAQIPQSTITDNTKRALLDIRDRTANDVRVWGSFAETTGICVEAHDALVALVRETEIDHYLSYAVPAFEAPIDFSQCTLPRGTITIPCEVKVGRNYKDLKDYVMARRDHALLSGGGEP